MALSLARASHPTVTFRQVAATASGQARSLDHGATGFGSWTLALRGIALGCLVITLSTQTGCSLIPGLGNALAYNTVSDDLVTGWRDNVWAKRAYNRRVAQMPVGRFESSFRDGFIDGYHSVAQGGNGCQPAMPPRKYWSWKYQTAEGQCKVQAWFQGWSYGAKAAEEDGLGFYREIQVSGAMEQTLREHGYGVDPDCPNCPPGYSRPAMPLPILEGAAVPTARPRVDAAMPPATAAPQLVRPVSYEVERLPPVASEQ